MALRQPNGFAAVLTGACFAKTSEVFSNKVMFDWAADAALGR